MNIAGFGDSFMQPIRGLGNVLSYDYSYVAKVAEYFNTEDFNTFGVSGSGSWDAFFEFQKQEKIARENGKPFDLVIFAWSNGSRLYHPRVRDICVSNVYTHYDSKQPLWQAARSYYEHLFDHNKLEYEMKAFFYWLDNDLKETYPNIKFIHLNGFPPYEMGQSVDNYYDYIKNNGDDIKYYTTWKNSVEVRPSLIYFSLMDDWPGDLSKEHRFQHLTPKMHSVVANLIIKAIDTYSPGNIIKYKENII
jgi:hypothetical protein